MSYCFYVSGGTYAHPVDVAVGAVFLGFAVVAGLAMRSTVSSAVSSMSSIVSIFALHGEYV